MEKRASDSKACGKPGACIILSLLKSLPFVKHPALTALNTVRLLQSTQTSIACGTQTPRRAKKFLFWHIPPMKNQHVNFMRATDLTCLISSGGWLTASSTPMGYSWQMVGFIQEINSKKAWTLNGRRYTSVCVVVELAVRPQERPGI